MQATLAVLVQEMRNVKSEIQEMKSDLKELGEIVLRNQQRLIELKPVKSIVYGFVSLILTAVIGSLLYLVIR